MYAFTSGFLAVPAVVFKKKSNVLQNTGNVYIQMLSGLSFASFLVLIRISAALNTI